MTDRPLVYVVDDDDAVRRAASFMLKTSGFQAKCFASGVDFLKQVGHAAPGCILLDVRMPGMDGIEVLRTLREHGITMPVIVLTGHGDVGVAVTAMKAGAIDFIEKPFEKSVLLSAIEEGIALLDKSDRHRTRAGEAAIRLKALTPRELDVLKGLVRGHPNKTIGYDLGISSRTVEIHRANLMAKLDVHSLSDVLRIAFAAGLGEAPQQTAPTNTPGTTA